jgi:hypothetical protein
MVSLSDSPTIDPIVGPKNRRAASGVDTKD